MMEKDFLRSGQLPVKHEACPLHEFLIALCQGENSIMPMLNSGQESLLDFVSGSSVKDSAFGWNPFFHDA